MPSPEQTPQNPEQASSKLELSAETLEKLLSPSSPENALEISKEKRVERANKDAIEAAVSVEKTGKEKVSQPKSAVRRRPTTVGKKQKAANYTRHIKQVQAELSPADRAFSKIVHAKPIEKASDIVGNTLARPNAVLAGAFSAFILVLAVYILAKTFGYPLSGFETIAAFIVGWILGVIYDYLKILFTGKV